MDFTKFYNRANIKTIPFGKKSIMKTQVFNEKLCADAY